MSTERRGTPEPHEPEFDREIDVRGILWTGIFLVALALVVSLLMWWLLRGFSRFDEKRDVQLTPIEAASPQQRPPEPRLQMNPNEDMRLLREEEDYKLGHAEWVSRQQGIVRLPVDVAMEEVLSRGVSAAQSASPAKLSPPPGDDAPKGQNLNSLGRQPQVREPSNDSKP